MSDLSILPNVDIGGLQRLLGQPPGIEREGDGYLCRARTASTYPLETQAMLGDNTPQDLRMAIGVEWVVPSDMVNEEIDPKEERIFSLTRDGSLFYRSRPFVYVIDDIPEDQTPIIESVLANVIAISYKPNLDSKQVTKIVGANGYELDCEWDIKGFKDFKLLLPDGQEI
jgi:hypothetical protein